MDTIPTDPAPAPHVPGPPSCAAAAATACGPPSPAPHTARDLVRHLARDGDLAHESIRPSATATASTLLAGDVLELVRQVRPRAPRTSAVSRERDDRHARHVAQLGCTLMGYVAPSTPLNPVVVLLYALFHDVQPDPTPNLPGPARSSLTERTASGSCGPRGHGLAAALLISRLERPRGGSAELRRLLGPDEMPFLKAACALHDCWRSDTCARTSRSTTIGVCWDATRLLLPTRAALDRSCLSTAAAHDPAVTAFARRLPDSSPPSWAMLARTVADVLIERDDARRP